MSGIISGALFASILFSSSLMPTFNNGSSLDGRLAATSSGGKRRLLVLGVAFNRSLGMEDGDAGDTNGGEDTHDDDANDNDGKLLF